MIMEIYGGKMRSTASLLAVFIGMLFFVSCGDDYEKPSTTQTGSSLISASTLKLWADMGKVNGTGYDRVVILDVNSYGTYTQNHIPGALFVDSGEIAQNRNDGVGGASYEVLDGNKMDELIQRYGIDGKTTIVFTSSSLTHPTRAYFTFRYWGFPKNRLKLLNGLNAAWASAYGLTPGDSPAVARSVYSVRNNGRLRDDLRVSLAEMIDYADGKVPNTVAIDVRGPANTGSYAGIRGKTPGMFNPGSDYVVFEGRIRGAKALNGSGLYSASNLFNSTDELITSFTDPTVGLDSTKTAYLYCVKGAASAVTFFVLDGILDWPAAVYDGSWSQWGQLSGNTSRKGKLDPASPWRTDIAGRSDLFVYNYETVVSAATFSGTGANDLVTAGSYTIGTDTSFIVEIQALTNPDTFRWTSNGGTSWTSLVMTGSAQALVSGVTVSFDSLAVHTVGDRWTFTGSARKAVEQFTSDPAVCSATYKADGTITNSFGVNSECSSTTTPSSFDTDANRIEEADKAYMSSGGSGGSSGGGGTVPAGC